MQREVENSALSGSHILALGQRTDSFQSWPLTPSLDCFSHDKNSLLYWYLLSWSLIIWMLQLTSRSHTVNDMPHLVAVLIQNIYHTVWKLCFCRCFTINRCQLHDETMVLTSNFMVGINSKYQNCHHHLQQPQQHQPQHHHNQTTSKLNQLSSQQLPDQLSHANNMLVSRQGTFRDPNSAPLRKMSVDLIKTYKRINDVCIDVFVWNLYIRISDKISE